MKKLLVSTAILSLIGCASAPAPRMAKNADPVEAPKTPAKYAMVAHNLSEYAHSTKCAAPSKVSVYSDWMKVAAACAGVAQWNRVEDLGNKMSIGDSSEPWGSYFLSLAAEGNKDLLRAQWMAELAVKKAPSEGIVLYQLGRIQWAMDDREGAAKTLQSATDKNPTLTEGFVFLGQMALLQDKTSEAQKRFAHAYEQDSKNFGAVMGLADVAVRKNDGPDADKYLHEAVSLRPNSMQAWMGLAQAQEIIVKDNEGALGSYTRIQKLVSSHKLDGTPSIDIASKVHALQTIVAEAKRLEKEQALKQKVSERKPSADGKVSK
jgi:tetratricopeptide (TPR) repeat protein